MPVNPIEEILKQSTPKRRWLGSIDKVNLLLWALTFAVVVYMWLEELLDLPYIFGYQRTPFNWVESLMETIVILLMGTFVIWLTNRLLHRIRYLEGFHAICASCKRIRLGDDWTSIEQYMSEYSSLQLSHSICPDCAKKLYGYTEEEGYSHKEHQQ